jgi:hypothetical protein
MMQVPPEIVMIPPDPNLIISQIVPIIGMLTGVVISGFVVLGPIGRAIGDVVRHLFGAGKKDAALASGDLDEVLGRLDAIHQQLGEIAERQDFTDRMLGQIRKDRALTGGSDVAG